MLKADLENLEITRALFITAKDRKIKQNTILMNSFTLKEQGDQIGM